VPIRGLMSNDQRKHRSEKREGLESEVDHVRAALGGSHEFGSTPPMTRSRCKGTGLSLGRGKSSQPSACRRCGGLGQVVLDREGKPLPADRHPWADWYWPSRTGQVQS
jgi:DnaJ-class molecular chaperone